MAVRWLSDRFLETLKKKEAEKKMKLINREESKHIYDFCHQLTDVLPGKKSTMKMYGINAMKIIINTLELQQENMKHLTIQQQILLKMINLQTLLKMINHIHLIQMKWILLK